MDKNWQTGRNGRGFTLIELLIVMTLIGILAAIAAPSYQRSLIRAREAVLLENLFQMRNALDAFFADFDRYPETLEELVETKYLRTLPVDPFTRRNDSWTVVRADPAAEFEPAREGIYDVHSGSNLVGLNGIPYREW
ncbi:MAG: prepilin-type N-terminal cleavage/methylation domain-containing protein [Deltaproteobacteria bacterium]|nr:prepilin-type N-terminal cleavage/methylation domain-containing protein [Deltaproteobacteria bacterium]